MSDTASSKFGS